MAERDLSRRELMRRKRESGFVGRGNEINAFRANFALRPDDEGYQFVFHVHGNAGVGKTWLVRRWEGVAQGQGALTAYADDDIHGVVEAMEAISEQFARQGAPLKGFDKLLATYRLRRHEAETALAVGDDASRGTAPPGPSAAGTAAARVGLAGLGMVPGLGALAGAVDPQQLALGGDRLRAALSARLRNHDDVQLVMAPVRALTPVFLRDVTEAAARFPWIVLLFDTYERTRPVLDGWLRGLVLDGDYGELPVNVLVVLSGQGRLGPDWPGTLVSEMPLDVFTEDEARQLLADKGITDPHLVEQILRVSGRLPVLVDTLARGRPHAPDAVEDPSDTAVDRFLKWETDPGRRAAALVCALPLQLDEDVYHAAVPEPLPGGYRWLLDLPFVTNQAGRRRYHDVVRAQMLRTQRTRSPSRWREDHTRLAGAFEEWREALEATLAPDARWDDASWQEFQLGEIYHRLCASPQLSLPTAVHTTVQACDHGPSVARRWAQMLAQAGQDAASPSLDALGRGLQTTADDDTHGTIPTLTLLLANPAAGPTTRALALAIRGREHRTHGSWDDSLADYNAALDLNPALNRAFAGRGTTYAFQRRYDEALADFDRAIGLNPEYARAIANRGHVYRLMHRYEEALADYDHAIALTPQYPWAITGRGEVHRHMGRYAAALADFNRAVELDPHYVRAIVARGMVQRSLGRYTEALTDHNRAVELKPESPRGIADRAEVHRRMGRYDAALTDFDRAVELDPDYAWALAHRALVHLRLHRYDDALTDLDRAVELAPHTAWILACRGQAHRVAGRHTAARTDLERALATDPRSCLAAHEYAVLSAVRGCDDTAARWRRSTACSTPAADGADAQALDARRHLVAACCALGDWTGAAHHLERFAAAGPNVHQVREAHQDLADLARALRLDPTATAPLLQHLGRLRGRPA